MKNRETHLLLIKLPMHNIMLVDKSYFCDKMFVYFWYNNKNNI